MSPICRKSRSALPRLGFQALECRELLATIGNNIARGDQLLHYRLAISATGEYTQHFGSAAAAYQAVVDVVADLNEIFEAELSVRLDLVSGLETIFPDPNTDPFTYDDIGAMRSQNQATLDSIIGPANYDVGHVFGKQGSGWAGAASIASVGNASNKAQGATNSSSPLGDTWVKALAHEIGHQFNGRHTYNGVNGSCSSGRASLAAYEPASGTTIMSYGGSCGSDNIMNGKDGYYHAANFEDIHTYLGNLGGSDTSHAAPYLITPTGNQIPSVDGGSDYTIPAGTPFALTAAGSDPDSGDSLTYTWEQLDLGPALALGSPDNGSSPLFRSFPPASDPTRVFPQLGSLLSGANSIGEVLPSTNRQLNFRATVRDGLGGVDSDDVRLTVVNSGSPFRITSLSGTTFWSGGSLQTITWDTAATQLAPINAADVRILLSTDGGATFPFMLATTENDGSYALQVPNISVPNARLKIEPVGNVFFAINSGTIAITANAGLPAVVIAQTGADTRAAEAGANDSYSVALNRDPAGTVAVQVTADSQSLVSLDGVNFAASQTVIFSSTAPQTITVRAVNDSAEEGRHSSLLTHTIVSSSSAQFPLPTLIDNLTAHIVDDELPPVAGVDFDWFDSPEATSPENWGQNPWLSTSNNNLLRDDGVPTGYDLTFSISGVGWGHTAPIFSESVPRHDPPLQAISGYSRRANWIVATFRDLIPGTPYGVYVFGLIHSGFSISQNVTITGATSLPTFTQSMNDRFLQINDQQGDEDRTLQSYEKVVTANSQGRIVIDVRPVSSGQWASLAGLAIREIPPMAATAVVVARHVFYNDSVFDGSAAANAADDDAVADDKSPLLPGQSANFTHYTNDPRGLTGVMVDIAGLPNAAGLQASDFTFRAGTTADPATWPELTTAPSISVRPGDGDSSSDRVTLIWPEGVIRNTWLQVTVKPTASTGLSAADVFYFGNAVGETGNSSGDTQVNASDYIAVRSSPRTFLNPAAVDDYFDLNRDGRVNAVDLLIVRDHGTVLGNSLPLWQAPASFAKLATPQAKKHFQSYEDSEGVGGAEPLAESIDSEAGDRNDDLRLAAAIQSAFEAADRRADRYAGLLSTLATEQGLKRLR